MCATTTLIRIDFFRFGSDNNSDDMEGGSISQDVLLKPVRTGTTTIKLYKILSPGTAKEDSAQFRTYTITIKK